MVITLILKEIHVHLQRVYFDKHNKFPYLPTSRRAMKHKDWLPKLTDFIFNQEFPKIGNNFISAFPRHVELIRHQYLVQGFFVVWKGAAVGGLNTKGLDETKKRDYIEK